MKRHKDVIKYRQSVEEYYQNLKEDSDNRSDTNAGVEAEHQQTLRMLDSLFASQPDDVKMKILQRVFHHILHTYEHTTTSDAREAITYEELIKLWQRSQRCVECDEPFGCTCGT